jgi:plasmid stabilization system protein ParE
MMKVQRHPLVDADVDEALMNTFKEFGASQVSVYAGLITQGLETIRQLPTIGRLRADLGDGVRVFCIAQGGVKAPHGYIYRVKSDVIQVARFVHLARYLPALVPEDF